MKLDMPISFKISQLPIGATREAYAKFISEEHYNEVRIKLYGPLYVRLCNQIFSQIVRQLKIEQLGN